MGIDRRRCSVNSLLHLSNVFLDSTLDHVRERYLKSAVKKRCSLLKAIQHITLVSEKVIDR